MTSRNSKKICCRNYSKAEIICGNTVYRLLNAVNYRVPLGSYKKKK